MQVSELEAMRTSSGEDEPVLGGLQKNRAIVVNISKRCSDKINKYCNETMFLLPADEVDDGFVFEIRVCCAGTSFFIRQL